MSEDKVGQAASLGDMPLPVKETYLTNCSPSPPMSQATWPLNLDLTEEMNLKQNQSIHYHSVFICF